MDLSTNNISFLKDVPSDIKVDKTSGWRYHYFDGSISELTSFIKLMVEDEIFLLIPIFIDGKSQSKAKLILSDPFLVDNKSNSNLIIKFILDQWNSSGFSLREGSIISFSFKFKRVWFNYKFPSSTFN
jgi:hypothetical protein